MTLDGFVKNGEAQEYAGVILVTKADSDMANGSKFMPTAIASLRYRTFSAYNVLIVDEIAFVP
jgi:hypothetical protein